jgi:2-succinyl-5-enolpyruvyl-6-hydroxy-3-cyclohexene-1-carboxylate synthase
MNTYKRAVRLIAEICRVKGIRKAVFSPGSRSSPLVIAFSQIREIECIVIPDERVAGYFALGMAQQLREVAAVICTSGSAVANLFPSVLEAHYQKIPLLIITADRPDGEVQRGGNQAIYQQEIFSHHAPCRTINGDAESDAELLAITEDIAQAIHECQLPEGSASHLNVRLSEPLYETIDRHTEVIALPEIRYSELYNINNEEAARIKQAFETHKTKMVIVGSHNYNAELLNLLTELNQRQDVVILYETLANTPLDNAVWNIDAALSMANKQDSNQFLPDIVITMGNHIVSKKIKQFLKGKPKLHWDVPVRNELGGTRMMFGSMLDRIAPINEKQFLEVLLSVHRQSRSDYKSKWLSLRKKAEEKTVANLSTVPFSDLKVFETLVKSYPTNAIIQYGNSSPIRYANFFQHDKTLRIYANRGTSGIDGCVSTAAGAAHTSNNLTICVVGDISFFYDSNALWNNHLSPNLRIIVINNGGGNIFRLIEGPTRLKDFEKFFETRHTLTAKHLASMYGLPYYICNSQDELDKTLKIFYEPHEGKPAILEITTNSELSAKIYHKYFDYLSNGD